MSRVFPSLGVGVGLRPFFYKEILEAKPSIDWFEIISENYMVEGGAPLYYLDQILEHYPVVQHGVNLAIGSATALDFDYLSKLKKLTKRTKTPWLSDHLSWGRLPSAHFHDLLPLPYTKEVIAYVVERARIVQDYLEIPFALENISSYASFTMSEMPEWDFYREIVERADIYMMLDVNNVYVSSVNQDFEPYNYFKDIPWHKVIQIHLAGHTDKGSYLLDTHNKPVSEAVWKLYADIYPLTCQASTLIEWDSDFPLFERLLEETIMAKALQNELCNKAI